MTATCPATPIHYPSVDSANSVVVPLADDQCISNRDVYEVVEAFMGRRRGGEEGEEAGDVNGCNVRGATVQKHTGGGCFLFYVFCVSVTFCSFLFFFSTQSQSHG